MQFLFSLDIYMECFFLKHIYPFMFTIFLFLLSSCLSSSGTTQSQSLTSVPTALSHLQTLATWHSISGSTRGWNPTPARTAKSPSDSSVIFSSTAGVCIFVFLSLLPVRLTVAAPMRSSVWTHPILFFIYFYVFLFVFFHFFFARYYHACIRTSQPFLASQIALPIISIVDLCWFKGDLVADKIKS